MNNIKPEILNSLLLNNINFDSSINLLNKGDISSSYVCIRPGNKQGVPKVISEKIDSKIYTSCYGHGGVGWSLLWGSAFKSIELFEELNQNYYKKDEKIVIIGSGIIGRGTALLLKESGYKNIEIISEKIDDLTSHNSGAFFSVSSVNSFFDMDEKSKKIYEEIIVKSFETWGKIIDSKFLSIFKGANRLKCYIGAEKDVGPIETDSGLEEVVEKGLIPKPELVSVIINNKTSHRMRKYDTFYFNTNVLMDEFHRLLKEKEIPITQRKIESLHDSSLKQFNVIFNCTGLNSRSILKDKDIFPIAGHIITINNQIMENLNYVIYSHYILPEEKEKYKDSKQDAPLFYFMPKVYTNIQGLLGGSFCNNYLDNDNQFNQEHFRGILRRTDHFFGLGLNLDNKIMTSSKSKF